MLVRTWAIAALTLVAVAAAGCTGTVDPAAPPPDGGPGGTGNATLPAPRMLLSHNQTLDDMAGSSSPYAATVTVEQGFNELLVGFAASGAGTVRLDVRDPADEVVHDTGDLPTTGAPDSHDQTPDATLIEAQPGDYALEVAWTGPVTYTLTATERNHEWTHQFDDQED